MGNRECGNLFAKHIGQYLAKQGIVVIPEYLVDVGLNSKYKKKHRFDYGNDTLIVECKYYEWTEGGNNPSAKISTLNEAMMMFCAAPSKYRKMLFIAKTKNKGARQPETLAEYYIRLYKSFVPDDVEIWEFDNDNLTTRKIFN